MATSYYSDDLRMPKPPRDEGQLRQGYGLLELFRHQLPGQWTDNRWEQSGHYRTVTYCAISAVMDLVGGSHFSVVRRTRRDRRKTTFGPGGAVAKAIPRTQTQGRDEDYTPFDDLDHPLARAAVRPNPAETFGELAAKLVLQNRLTGVAPLWTVPNSAGKPVEFWALKTALTYPLWGQSHRYPEGAWRVTPFYGPGWMGITPTGMGAYGSVLPGREVRRWMEPHPLIDFDGYSPLSAGGTPLDVLESIDESRKSAMDFGLQLDAVLIAPGLDGDAVTKISKDMTQKMGGSKNSRKLAVVAPPVGLGEKATLQTLGQSPREMDFAAGWDQMTKFVLALFRVPSAAAGLTENSSYSELYASIKQLQHNQSNYCRRLETFLSKSMCWPWCSFPDEYLLRVKMPALDDPDMLEKQLSADAGIRSVNERRAVRDLDPVEHGEWPEQIYLKVLESKAVPQQPAGGPGGQPGGGGNPLAALLGGGKQDDAKGPPAQPGDVPQPANPQAEGSLPPKTLAKAMGEGVGSAGGFLVPPACGTRRRVRRRKMRRVLKAILSEVEAGS